MSAYEASASFTVRGGPTSLLAALLEEVAQTLGAMLNPRQVIADVEQMQALRAEAARIEAAQPQRAAALRRQAARLGLR